MSWNIRLIQHDIDENDCIITLHEVYYDEAKIPFAYSEKAASPHSNSDNPKEYKQDIEEYLQWMHDTLKKPILLANSFSKK